MFRSNFRFKKQRSKEDFCLYNPHSQEGFAPIPRKFIKELGDWGESYIGTVSLDPGTVNIGMHINFFWSSGISKSYSLERFDFSQADRQEATDDIQIYNQAIEKLDTFLPLFEKVHFILIESQLSINPNAVRMSQHFISYFLIKLKDRGLRPLIVEISPELKTSYLGGPRGRKKGQTSAQAKTLRKEWCRDKAEKILNYFKDEMVEKVIKKRAKKGKGKSKKDDMGDVVCQTYVWLLLCSVNDWWKDFLKSDLDLKEALSLEEEN